MLIKVALVQLFIVKLNIVEKTMLVWLCHAYYDMINARIYSTNEINRTNASIVY
jgi:hypothetical protein